MNEQTKIAVPCWKARALQELKTDFERKMYGHMLAVADDAGTLGLYDDAVERAVFNLGTDMEFVRMGYFFGTVKGPNHYIAHFIYATPYTAPIIALEWNTDMLQVDENEAEGPAYRPGDTIYFSGTNVKLTVEAVRYVDGEWRYKVHGDPMFRPGFFYTRASVQVLAVEGARKEKVVDKAKLNGGAK